MLIRFSEKLQFYTSCEQTEIMILSENVRINEIMHALKTMFPRIHTIGSRMQVFDENLNLVHYQDPLEPDGNFYVDIN